MPRMSILKVAQMGHPVLRTPAEPVALETISSPEFQQLVDDMIETLQEYEGIGLAAPQVHVGQRLCLIGVVTDAGEGEPQRIEILVAINPILTPLTEETILGV